MYPRTAPAARALNGLLSVLSSGQHPQYISDHERCLFDAFVVDDHESSESIIAAFTDAGAGRERMQFITTHGVPHLCACPHLFAAVIKPTTRSASNTTKNALAPPPAPTLHVCMERQDAGTCDIDVRRSLPEFRILVGDPTPTD
jgi:hypothetical protein